MKVSIKSHFIIVSLLIMFFGLAAAFYATKNLIPQQTNRQLPLSSPSIIAEKTTSSASAEPTQSTELVKVTRVVDGDTIEIEGGQKVRYIGINTPETVDPRKPIECYGAESSQKNKELVEGKTIRLENDVSETDKYGRLLRYVYLSSEALAKEDVGDIFVNDYLVRQGFAYASTYPPDVKYQDQFANAQQEAMSKNLGLWSACQGAATVQNQNETQTRNCLIKGNISSSGEKIYHTPGQRYYDKTVIDQSKGEHWFCTENEAQQAGWRKSKI